MFFIHSFPDVDLDAPFYLDVEVFARSTRELYVGTLRHFELLRYLFGFRFLLIIFNNMSHISVTHLSFLSLFSAFSLLSSLP